MFIKILLIICQFTLIFSQTCTNNCFIENDKRISTFEKKYNDYVSSIMKHLEIEDIEKNINDIKKLIEIKDELNKTHQIVTSSLSQLDKFDCRNYEIINPKYDIDKFITEVTNAVKWNFSGEDDLKRINNSIDNITNQDSNYYSIKDEDFPMNTTIKLDSMLKNTKNIIGKPCSIEFFNFFEPDLSQDELSDILQILDESKTILEEYITIYDEKNKQLDVTRNILKLIKDIRRNVKNINELNENLTTLQDLTIESEKQLDNMSKEIRDKLCIIN